MIRNLNTESIRSKFDTLVCLVDHLKDQNIEISAIALQETLLNENADTCLFELPGYHLISQGSICSTKGGLFIYLHKQFDYILRNLYSKSVWHEALYVDVTGNSLNRTITIGNIYRPPRGNNNNNSVRHFLSEFSPVLHKLGREKSDTIICGDFNINLLKVNEREIFAEFLDLFLSNGFLPQISLPTRFSTKNATLIDQIFCKLSNITSDTFSGILISQMSDHLPSFSSLDVIKAKERKPPKFIKMQINDTKSQQNFCDAIGNVDILNKLNHSPNADVNENYSILCDTIQTLKNKHLPTKTVKYHKHKHKNSPWITTDII